MLYKHLTTCILLVQLIIGCGTNNTDSDITSNDSVTTPPTVLEAPDGDNAPVITADATYSVLTVQDIQYADGLGHDNSSTTPFAIPQKLDLYYPDNTATKRPAFIFIHGGGFTGGTKTKPEIVEMGNYFAARGWVFLSVDYRTTEELGTLNGLTREKVFSYYKGIAPAEWIEHALLGAETTKQFQQSLAMYTAQRDAKAAVRWLMANAETYQVDKSYLTVGGASAGAITTVALGISDLGDFRDEITVEDDPTLSTTHLDQDYTIKSLIYFWGSNIKLDVFEGVYGLEQYERYDANDPELFMAHGDQYDPVTPYEEAIELQQIYDSLDIHNKLVTLYGEGHGAWHAEVDGKGLFEMSFDFIVERQSLTVE